MPRTAPGASRTTTRATVKTIRKALTAAAATGLATLGTAMLDGALTLNEGIAAAGTALLAGAAVYKVKNDTQEATP